ncbi:hypothetical protein IE53DRAFT_58570 [Violaceomyces palustris]|uniref:Uncharacterized protein n=1 Tax=Violaceomyces palustris TaxID=1673888 RepID=A0ACD0NZQ9_9BASI|nr:hypothetical protein IE53DRAFT_58570 [Violaceomyces palustris]
MVRSKEIPSSGIGIINLSPPTILILLLLVTILILILVTLTLTLAHHPTDCLNSNHPLSHLKVESQHSSKSERKQVEDGGKIPIWEACSSSRACDGGSRDKQQRRRQSRNPNATP